VAQRWVLTVDRQPLARISVSPLAGWKAAPPQRRPTAGGGASA